MGPVVTNPTASDEGAGGVPRFRIRVQAGEHDRHDLPVFATLPLPLRRPVLYRLGRARPVPCQLEASRRGPRLWWMLDRLSAGETAEYTAQDEYPRRAAPKRVELLEGPMDAPWELRVGGVTAGLVLTPARGPVEVLLPGLPGRNLHVWNDAYPIGEARPPSALAVRTLEPPSPQTGPVFAKLVVRQGRLDDRERLFWSESTVVRAFAASHSASIVDISTTWQATTGTVALRPDLSRRALRSDDPRHADERPQPTLIADVTGGDVKTWLSAEGHRGPGELHGIRTGLLANVGAAWSGLILEDERNPGYPSRWRSGERGRLTATPVLAEPRNSLREIATGVRLGGRFRRRFRLIWCRVPKPQEYAAARRLDYLIPPTVEVAPDDGDA